MPRRPRIVLPGVPLHVIQRGNNRQACFYSDEVYIAYLSWLIECSRSSSGLIHGYMLMTNLAHLLLTTETEASTGELMKSLGQGYVQYINYRKGL